MLSKNVKKFIIISLASFVLLYAGYTFVQQGVIMLEQQKQTQQMEQELARIKMDNQNKQNQIEQIGSDEHAKQVARDQIGWVEEGDIIYQKQ